MDLRDEKRLHPHAGLRAARTSSPWVTIRGTETGLRAANNKVASMVTAIRSEG
jgi:hypothetical protein